MTQSNEHPHGLGDPVQFKNGIISKMILYCGQTAILACDGKCHKAWGRTTRPMTMLSANEDDYVFKSDAELGNAPWDPGTYEGGHAKPETGGTLNNGKYDMNKWCARECERASLLRPGDPIVLQDFNNPEPNIK